jgi:hypothetical protein
MTGPGYTDFDVPEETVRLLCLFGHVRLAGEGVYELTDAGRKWLREWCDQRLAEHGATP